jgi:hypothetical protein
LKIILFFALASLTGYIMGYVLGHSIAIQEFEAKRAELELDEDEWAEVTKQARDTLAEDVDCIVSMLKERPMTRQQILNRHGLPAWRFKAAWKAITGNPADYGLASYDVLINRNHNVFYGLPGAVKQEAESALLNWQKAHRVTRCHEVTRDDKNPVGRGDKVTFPPFRGECNVTPSVMPRANGDEVTSPPAADEDIDPLTLAEVMI